MTPEQRAWGLIGVLAGVPAVVVALIVFVTTGAIVGVIVLVVVAVADTLVIVTGLETRVRRAVGGRPADPEREARLINLVEGLTVGAGVRPPEVLVLDDPALNLAVFGRRTHHQVLVVTAGLLAELTRIELEGILATAVVAIRRGTTGPATVSASLRGIGAARIMPSNRDTDDDLAAVALTRYPPGLASAVDKMDAKGTALRQPPGATALLWLADPGGPPQIRRTALQSRVETLREL